MATLPTAAPMELSFAFSPPSNHDHPSPTKTATPPLARKFPGRAKDLFAKSEAAAQARFAHLEKLVELYK